MIVATVLSSSSILLALLTAIYGFFYPSIKEVLDMKAETGGNIGNNKPCYWKAVDIKYPKLATLKIGGVIISAIFFPEFINQIVNVWNTIKDNGIRYSDYNIPAAAFMAVSFFSIAQTYNIFVLNKKVNKKINSLKYSEDAVIAADKRKRKEVANSQSS